MEELRITAPLVKELFPHSMHIFWHNPTRADSYRPTAATEASVQTMSFVPPAYAHLAASAQLA